VAVFDVLDLRTISKGTMTRVAEVADLEGVLAHGDVLLLSCMRKCN
jgi:hypothetical protein